MSLGTEKSLLFEETGSGLAKIPQDFSLSQLPPIEEEKPTQIEEESRSPWVHEWKRGYRQVHWRHVTGVTSPRRFNLHTKDEEVIVTYIGHEDSDVVLVGMSPSIPKTISPSDISATESTEQLVGLLQPHVSEHVSNRLRTLLTYDDPSHPDYEPDGNHMDLGALRNLALFLADAEPSIPTPRIGVGSEGKIGIEWYLDPIGLFSVTFTAEPIVRWGAISGRVNPQTGFTLPESERWSFGGSYPNNAHFRGLVRQFLSSSWRSESP